MGGGGEDGIPSQLPEDEDTDGFPNYPEESESDDSVSSAFSQSPFVPIVQWFSQNTVPPGFDPKSSERVTTSRQQTDSPSIDWDEEILDEDIWEMEPLFQDSRVASSPPTPEAWINSSTPVVVVEQKEMNKEHELHPANGDEEGQSTLSSQRNVTVTEKSWEAAEMTDQTVQDEVMEVSTIKANDGSTVTSRWEEEEAGVSPKVNGEDDEERYESSTMRQETSDDSQEVSNEEVMSHVTMKMKTTTKLASVATDAATQSLVGVTDRSGLPTERITEKISSDQQFISSIKKARILEGKQVTLE